MTPSMKTATLIVLLALCSAAPADTFTPIPADATVDQVLDGLRTRGDTLKCLSADVSLAHTDQTTATTDTESGKILLQQRAGGTSRVRVAFNQRTEDQKYFAEDHEFTLADGWLVDRDGIRKHEDRRQVVRPGEQINLFQLGDGPFPLPIGQKKEDVLRDFDVKLVPVQKDDAPDWVHLTLKPKPETKLARKFAQIDVYVNRQTGMPERIVTLDAGGQATRTADLTHVNLDVQLSDSDFALPPLGPGWDQVEEPFTP
jgi:outer membrane lipoprotein-sorting protein